MCVLIETIFGITKHEFQIHLMKSELENKKFFQVLPVMYPSNFVKVLKEFDAALVCSHQLQRIS